MRPYGRPDQDQGVVAYDLGADFIRIEFVDGSIYRYDASRPGVEHVDRMKALAEAGRGLTTYINQHVRENYARRER
jgi:hypothetical protein